MVAEIGEAIGRLVFGLLGLRYLFSSKYRKKVHKNWSSQSRLVIAGEVIEVVLGVIFLGVIVYAVIYVTIAK